MGKRPTGPIHVMQDHDDVPAERIFTPKRYPLPPEEHDALPENAPPEEEKPLRYPMRSEDRWRSVRDARMGNRYQGLHIIHTGTAHGSFPWIPVDPPRFANEDHINR